MPIISADKFFLWRKKQLLKGGDNLSLNLLIDLLGGQSDKELNLVVLVISKLRKIKIIFVINM